jgi:hypothetical protein
MLVLSTVLLFLCSFIEWFILFEKTDYFYGVLTKKLQRDKDKCFSEKLDIFLQLIR